MPVPGRPVGGMWKFRPEMELLSRDDSTDGKGSSSSAPGRESKGGGVRAFWRGDAVYDGGWNGLWDDCCVGGMPDWKAGGMDDRCCLPPAGAEVTLAKERKDGDCGP